MQNPSLRDFRQSRLLARGATSWAAHASRPPIRTPHVRLAGGGAVCIVTDIVPGAGAERPELARLIDHARLGDSLCVSRLDRLGAGGTAGDSRGAQGPRYPPRQPRGTDRYLVVRRRTGVQCPRGDRPRRASADLQANQGRLGRRLQVRQPAGVPARRSGNGGGGASAGGGRHDPGKGSSASVAQPPNGSSGTACRRNAEASLWSGLPRGVCNRSIPDRRIGHMWWANCHSTQRK